VRTSLSLTALLALVGGCHDFSKIRPAVDAATDGPLPSVAGLVLRYETMDPTPFRDMAKLNVWNVAIPPGMTSPTATSDASGSFVLDDVPVGAAAELELRPVVDQLPNDAGMVAAGVRTHVSLRIPPSLPLQQNVPLVSFPWLAQVAVDCGIYPTIDKSLYGDGGFTDGDFVSRSVVLGELQEADGTPYKGAAVQPGDITVLLGDMDPEPNNVGNPDTGSPRSSVCFLDRNLSTGEYIGSKATSSTAANRFVMFRVRNSDGTGQGTAVVHVKGFAPSSVYLLSSGAIGVVALRVGDDPSPPMTAPPRTFHNDVYPLLGMLGCLGGCHTPPDGTGYTMTQVRNLPGLDLSSETMALSTLMAGESDSCVNVATPSRVCPADPAKSLMLTLPLTHTDNSGHPYPVFDSTNDPNYMVIEQWISENLPP
jgi:hypothetical protein